MPIKIKNILYPVNGKLEEISGRIVTEKNYQSIADWIKPYAWTFKKINRKTGKESNHRIEVITKKGKRIARIGDAVFKIGPDSYIVIKAAELARLVMI